MHNYAPRTGGRRDQFVNNLPNQNNPQQVLEFAVGPLNFDWKPQRPESGIKLHGLYHNQVRTYVLKKAHISYDDWRVFDATTKQLVYNSHHPGKNPLGSLDPLGVLNTEDYTTAGFGEWESKCDVSGIGQYKIRPKHSLHGRTLIKTMDDSPVLNIAKKSKLKTMSLQAQFTVNAGENKRDAVYAGIADIGKRTIKFINKQNELVAVAIKPPKTLILNALIGKGSEFRLDVAPGVDSSAFIAIMLGVMHMGKTLAKDGFSNFVKEPVRDQIISNPEEAIAGVAAAGVAVNELSGGGIGEGIGELTGGIGEGIGELTDGGGEIFDKIGHGIAHAGGWLFDAFTGGGD